MADAHRLAIVDELFLCDRTPKELGTILGIDSNLVAHHLRILETAGLIERVVSQGDKRRRYIRLTPKARQLAAPAALLTPRRIVFVCTENTARSQLAQGIWNQTHQLRAISAGTRPAKRVHPAAIRAAARRGIDLKQARPVPLPPFNPDDLIITVCDRAHEELDPEAPTIRLHWSIPDPGTSTGSRAFDASAETISVRIADSAPYILPTSPGRH